MTSGKKWYKRKLVWAVAVVIIIGLFLAFGRKAAPPEFSSESVSRTTLLQSVSETGSVVAKTDIEFGWETSGRVVAIFKDVGDEVTQGDLIAQIGASREQSSLGQSQAALQAAQAELDKLIAGATAEEIQESLARVRQAEANVAQADAQLEQSRLTSQIRIDDAQSAVDTAENNLRQAEEADQSELVQEAYEDMVNELKDARRILTDKLNGSDAILGLDERAVNDAFEQDLGIQDQNTLNAAKAGYFKNAASVAQVNAVVDPLTLESDHAEVDAAVFVANRGLQDMRAHYVELWALLQASSAESQLNQTQLDTLRSDVSTSQTTLDTAIAEFTNAKQAVANVQATVSNFQVAYDKALRVFAQAEQQGVVDIAAAASQRDIKQAALEQAEAAHDVLIAPPRDVDLAALRAEIRRQQSSVGSAASDYNKTKLIALADGVLSTLDVDIGENVVANTAVAAIISPQVHIEVDVSESDIAKVAVGDQVMVTLDAFGDDVAFNGSVVTIDPSETEVSGVIYYKTTVLLDAFDGYNVLPGMTANVQIVTDTKDDVLIIPQRAILNEDGKKYVRVLTDEATAAYDKKEVTTGLRGDDGKIEILSGLSVDDVVITFIKEEK